MGHHRVERERSEAEKPQLIFQTIGTLVFNEFRTSFQVKEGDGHKNPCLLITAKHDGVEVSFFDFRHGMLERARNFERGLLVEEELRAFAETDCEAKVFRKNRGGKTYSYVVLHDPHESRKDNRPVTPGFLAQHFN